MPAAGASAGSFSAKRRLTRLQIRVEWDFLASASIWFLLLVNFSGLAMNSGDSLVQYGFVQRMFGDAHSALGYYFGLALIEAPFYAIGKLLHLLGLKLVLGRSIEQAS